MYHQLMNDKVFELCKCCCARSWLKHGFTAINKNYFGSDGGERSRMTCFPLMCKTENGPFYFFWGITKAWLPVYIMRASMISGPFLVCNASLTCRSVILWDISVGALQGAVARANIDVIGALGGRTRQRSARYIRSVGMRPSDPMELSIFLSASWSFNLLPSAGTFLKQCEMSVGLDSDTAQQST